MQHKHRDLSQYRLQRAQEDLETARLNYENGMYKAAVNRSYYAIFHAIRAVNILDGFMSTQGNLKGAPIKSLILHTVAGKSAIIPISLLSRKRRQRSK